MSLGPSLSSFTLTDLFHSSFFNTSKQQNKRHHYRASSSSLSSSSSTTHNNRTTKPTKYSYRTCPICSQKLLVRINGSFVYKWISTHFSTHHHEWMHVVVNLHES